MQTVNIIVLDYVTCYLEEATYLQKKVEGSFMAGSADIPETSTEDDLCRIAAAIAQHLSTTSVKH